MSSDNTTLLLTQETTGGLLSRAWSIEVIEGPDAGMTLVRQSGSITVGSHEDTDLTLTDPTVSRYHVELQLLAEGVMACDLGTTNGTRAGGVRIERALLQPGGTLRIGRTKLRVEPRDRPETLGDEVATFGEISSASPAMRKVLAILARAAPTQATVLLQGDSGTGKELAARALHAASPRAGGSFVVVDCGAIAPTLLESELFGHLRGSFTGATADRQGAFEAAGGGTLFLDELAELPLELQPKLLRALEARTVRRVGDTSERPFDARFVAATSRSLDRLVDEGAFRKDLYYRVAVVRVGLPPLCERPEDIPMLARLFVEQLGGGAVRLSDGANAILMAHDWPGNVRELRNVVERAIALAPGNEIGAQELLPAGSEQSLGRFHEAKEEVVRAFERSYVSRLLERHHGNVSSAAREAGLTRKALYAVIKRAGIDAE